MSRRRQPAARREGRPPPSQGGAPRVVASGRIQVDARKAMAKLREHLLVDLHDYALEVVRAAVASDAEWIDVFYDADDVIVTWRGRPFPLASLEQLLDHVLTEAADEDGWRVRLLALGVNAALGLAPAFVEVTWAADDGATATRARFVGKGAGEDAAPEAKQRVVERPAELPVGAFAVHVRRRIGWGVLRRATLGGAPEEVASLLRATEGLATPLTLRGGPWPRPSAPPVVARVGLELADDGDVRVRDAVLEVLDPRHLPDDYHPTLDMLELGVLLARYTWAPASFPAAPHAGVALPVRVRVDAERLPTNASRSSVREDSALSVAVEEASQAAFVRAVEGLVASHRAEATEGIELVGDARAIEEALGALACLAIGVARSRRKLSPLARSLVKLPLFRDACGVPRAFGTLEPPRGEPLVVYEGDEPLREELLPWAFRVMWPAGRVVERAMLAFATAPASALLEAAEEALALRTRFLAHATKEVAVTSSNQHLSREAFAVERGPFAELYGEVAVRSQGRRDGTTLRVFYLNRELAVRTLTAEACPLALDVALAWDAKLTPRYAYDGVESTPALADAIWYALRVGLLQVAGLVERLGEAELSDAVRAAIRRAARRAVGLITLGPAAVEARVTRASRVSLAGVWSAAAIWPTTSGEHVSFDALRSTVAAHGACFVAEPEVKGRALDGRPVLALEPSEASWVTAAFPATPVVPYGRAVVDAELEPAFHRARWRQLDRVAAAMAPGGAGAAVSLRFERPGVLGVVAIAEAPCLVQCHAGHVLGRVLRARGLGAIGVAVDDVRSTPNPDWTGTLHDDPSRWRLEEAELELLATCVGAREGDARSRAALGIVGEGAAPAVERALERFLVEAGAELAERVSAGQEAQAPRDERLAELYERIAALPLLRWLDAEGVPRPVSMATVEHHHPFPGPVPVLAAPAGFATLDWHPLVLDGAMERAVGRWLMGRLASAAPELEERRALARRFTRRGQVLARTALEAGSLGELGAHGPTLARYDALEVSVLLGLGPGSGRRGAGRALLTLSGRPLFAVDTTLPIVARVDLIDDAWLDGELAALTAEGTKALTMHLERAAAQLVIELAVRPIDQDGGSSFTDPGFAQLAAAVLHAPDLGPRRGAVERALRHNARWPKVQGGHAPLTLLGSKARLRFGADRYPQWVKGRRRSELDDPILYLPPAPRGRDLRSCLNALGVTLEDVTAALAQLQERRRGPGYEASTTTLAGPPRHRALRATFASLRLAIGGELELVPLAAPSVSVTDLEGMRTVDVAVGCPLRAVMVIESPRASLTDAVVAEHLQKAVGAFFTRLASRLDELPEEVRHGLRGFATYRLNRGDKLTKRQLDAAVVQDVTGAWYELRRLVELTEVWAIAPAERYPTISFERPLFPLTDAEMAALSRLVRVVDQRALVERALAGERRRAAAPAPLCIPEALQSCCLMVRAVAEPHLRGEAALLAATSVERAGIFVHVDGRPLCQLAPRGWPTVAVVDVDGVTPNPFFDGLSPEDEARVVEAVAELTEAMIAARTSAPRGCRGEIAVRVVEDGLEVTGHLWLPPAWPAQPVVTVEAVDARGIPQAAPLTALSGHSVTMSSVVPIGGHLMVAQPAPLLHQALGELARRALAEMLHALAPRAGAAADVELEAYRWNLALLGGEVDGELSAPSTEGRVGLSEVVDAIATGTVWYTARRGSRGGVLPSEGPAFVLPDEPEHALLRVLRARCPLVLVELGGVEPVARSQPPLAARVATHAEARPAALDAERLGSNDEGERGVAAEEEIAVEDSWFAGLTRRVLAVFTAVPPPLPVTRGFRDELEATLHLLDLPMDTLASVAFTRSGRAVRYRPAERRVIVNRDHAVVRALVPDATEPSPVVLGALAAAAVSELNRAHGAVTAAEELHALEALAELTQATKSR